MRIRIKVVRPYGSWQYCSFWEFPRLVFIRHIILFGEGRDKISLELKRK